MNRQLVQILPRLYELLPSENAKILFPYSFSGTPSVKDATEAIGIPHVEVDLILVNSLTVGLTWNY